ncbi:ATP-binding protein [Arcobacter sp. CECT 8985]|uniref:ATP-binding protein n=1 Tax=Arcobacter sp. CECT 8985 TaxID=1935424 RepID=UPI00100BCD58|nr:ATP-binding protein [Arcobacter sp. CECT 8985]RXJ86599.1 hypothetical protein CRU93_07940 [Arcobacter sp. CECT 8985]
MKNLKSTISSFIIFSVIVVSIIIGVLSVISLYDMKINSVEHSQKQILKQVRSQAEDFLNKIEKTATYVLDNYDSENRILKNIIDLNSDISSIFILNNAGKLIDFYATKNDHIYKGFDYSNKVFFKSVNNTKKTYWSNIFLSSLDNKPSISYTLKGKNEIIVILLKIEKFSNFITKFKNSDKSHMIRILDEKGVFIYNPDFQKLVNQRFNVKNNSIYNDLIKNNKQYKLASYIVANTNMKNFGMYTKIDKTKWIIVVRESYDVVLNTLKGYLILVFMLVAFFIIFIMYLIFKVFNKIFKQFDYLQKTINDIANGDYLQTVKLASYKEIHELVKSFEKMKIEINKREDNLKKSLENFEFLFNSTMEAIIIHDTKKCIDVNNVTIKLLGAKTKEDIINKSIYDFIDESSLDNVLNKIHKDIEPYEINLKRLNGEIFTVLTQGKFVELNGMRVKISNFVDITEFKNKDKLIFQQSKMVSMGEMIGNIAHQWRQPLSSISTAASGIKIEKEVGLLDDETLEDSLDMIIKNTRYLSKTIDDFRNFFKIDKDIDIININIIIDKALKLLSASFKNHYIKIKKDFTDNLFIKGYANELTQAFINIINNAKDALKEQDVDKKVIFISTKLEDNKVVIYIKDNAGGIPESIQSKIFEPYFTTKHKKQGTGIGLYMTHQIVVDHMEGRIDIQNVKTVYENCEYLGCEFKIYFNSVEST